MGPQRCRRHELAFNRMVPEEEWRVEMHRVRNKRVGEGGCLEVAEGPCLFVYN